MAMGTRFVQTWRIAFDQYMVDSLIVASRGRFTINCLSIHGFIINHSITTNRIQNAPSTGNYGLEEMKGKTGYHWVTYDDKPFIQA